MAASEADEAEWEGGTSVGNMGGVNPEETDDASTCHSFWDEVGREAGVKGVRLSAGRVQQTGVEQCFTSQPRQQQLDFVPSEFAPEPADAAGTLCQTRTNPSKMTSVVFTSRCMTIQ
jgi:hypothetical protein